MNRFNKILFIILVCFLSKDLLADSISGTLRPRFSADGACLISTDEHTLRCDDGLKVDEISVSLRRTTLPATVDLKLDIYRASPLPMIFSPGVPLPISLGLSSVSTSLAGGGLGTYRARIRKPPTSACPFVPYLIIYQCRGRITSTDVIRSLPTDYLGYYINQVPSDNDIIVNNSFKNQININLINNKANTRSMVIDKLPQ